MKNRCPFNDFQAPCIRRLVFHGLHFTLRQLAFNKCIHAPAPSFSYAYCCPQWSTLLYDMPEATQSAFRFGLRHFLDAWKQYKCGNKVQKANGINNRMALNKHFKQWNLRSFELRGQITWLLINIANNFISIFINLHYMTYTYIFRP